jgi:hypothetical protein
MKKIANYLSLVRRLRNAEHYDIFENVVLHIAAIVLKPAALLPAWNYFLQIFGKEDEIYKRNPKHAETKLIKETHEKRKTSYMAFKLCIETAVYSDDAQVKAAGQTLADVIDNYSDIYYAPMTEASALVMNMIQEVKKEKYAPQVTLVGAGNFINRLKEDNDEFMAIYAERTSNKEYQKDEGSLVEARRQTDLAFANFADSVNVFYRTNEMQSPKDPEVSATLSDIIHFVNSYIHQYETIYARRNPKYRPGSDDNDEPTQPGEDQPADSLPEITVAEQAILGNSVAVSGYGMQMSLRASDQEAFATALYPIARNGVVRLYNPESEAFDDFPVSGFLLDDDGTTPIGLIVDVPATNVFFEKPFMGIGDAQRAELLKDDEPLGILLDVQYPATMIAS